MEKASRSYTATLRERKKTSRVYRQYQEAGLAIAEILHDRRHKSLYIKLAKEHDQEELIQIAKDVASRPNVKNLGAYFMRVAQKSIAQQKSRRGARHHEG